MEQHTDFLAMMKASRARMKASLSRFDIILIVLVAGCLVMLSFMALCIGVLTFGHH